MEVVISNKIIPSVPLFISYHNIAQRGTNTFVIIYPSGGQTTILAQSVAPR